MIKMDEVQGARSTETGMYMQYMRISSTAQRRNSPFSSLNDSWNGVVDGD
jgi:hypothetical protein